MPDLYRILFWCLLLAVLGFTSCQPTKKGNQSDTSENVQKATIEDVERGIRTHIEAQTKEGNGYFHFSNDTSDFKLKLVRVHTEYLSVLGPNTFFACVDLATAEGDVYDVDFFLKGTKENMEVTRTDLHKLNGKPYYTWKQAKDKTWYTVPVAQASNELLGVVEGQDQFEFTYAATLPEMNGPAKMWVPIAQSDDFQSVELISIQAPGEQKMISDEKYGNKILYLRLSPEHSGQKVNINYKVKRLEKSPYKEENINLGQYLEGTELIPIGDRFGIIAGNVIEERNANSDLTKARALYDYVIDNVRYAKQGAYGTGDANFACDSKSGNCTEFHSLFISLARSAGIPARFAVGAAIPSARDEGGVNGYHCWAEFYAEGKWWPVDISEADKYTALATYYFGHHPANRIEFSRGRDIEPDIMPQSGAINFLAYPVLEVKGKPDLANIKFTFKRNTIDA
jgi:hypothetical protein